MLEWTCRVILSFHAKDIDYVSLNHWLTWLARLTITRCSCLFLHFLRHSVCTNRWKHNVHLGYLWLRFMVVYVCRWSATRELSNDSLVLNLRYTHSSLLILILLLSKQEHFEFFLISHGENGGRCRSASILLVMMVQLGGQIFTFLIVLMSLLILLLWVGRRADGSSFAPTTLITAIDWDWIMRHTVMVLLKIIMLLKVAVVDLGWQLDWLLLDSGLRYAGKTTGAPSKHVLLIWATHIASINICICRIAAAVCIILGILRAHVKLLVNSTSNYGNGILVGFWVNLAT